MIKLFNLTYRWGPIRYYHSESMDLGIIAMKEYSTFPKAPELEPHSQDTRWRDLTLLLGCSQYVLQPQLNGLIFEYILNKILVL